MAFTTKRGRPKVVREQTDMGTPELQFKRAHGVTEEAIDICLNKNLITPTHHWCGLHLRWLYTLRYGAPNISSTLTRWYDAPSPRPDDPLWRSAREAEFAEAVNMLRQHTRYTPVAQLAIFNERPTFLNEAWRNAAWKNNRARESLLREYQHLTEGLSLLETHWKPSQNTAL
jgi:hypothetical protein